MRTPVHDRGIARWYLLGMVLIAGRLSWFGNRGLRAHGASEDGADRSSEIEFVVRSTDLGDSGPDALIVVGWSRSDLDTLSAAGAWDDVLQVRIDLPDHDSAELPAMVGDYRVVEGDAAVHFLPRYGWSPGRSYVAMLSLRRAREIMPSARLPDGDTLETSFHVPSADIPDEPTTVTAIYPTADELPENLLRFYVEFSQPMLRGDVYDTVQLVGADGTLVEAPFLQIGREFWDRSMRRLTIILDPGRIKRGVGPNVQAGSPLSNHGRYELVIGAGMTDAYRRPLTEAVRKVFTVVAPDHRSPDPTRWTLSSPIAGTRDTLTIDLDGAIDPFLAQRLIRLEDGSGRMVSAAFSFMDAERIVRLTPTEEWTNGPYRLAVHPTLEDFAGNRVESVFDMAPGTVADLEATAHERRPAYIEIEVIAAPL